MRLSATRIEISKAETLDERDGAGLGLGALEPRLLDPVRSIGDAPGLQPGKGKF